MIQIQISECDTVYHGIFTSAASGFNAQTSVRAAKNTVFHSEVDNAARHLASQCNRTMPVLHKTLADTDIFRWSFIFLSHINLAALYSDAVITHREMNPQYIYVFAGFRIAPIGVW